MEACEKRIISLRQGAHLDLKERGKDGFACNLIFSPSLKEGGSLDGFDVEIVRSLREQWVVKVCNSSEMNLGATCQPAWNFWWTILEYSEIIEIINFSGTEHQQWCLVQKRKEIF